MTIKDTRDVISGLLLLLVGAGAGFAAVGYGVGTPSATEPGFFPLILSALIALCGWVILLKSVDFSGKAKTAGRPLTFDPWHVWSLLVVAGGFVLFGILLPVTGLFVTCLVTITAVGAGSRLLTPISAFVTAALLGAVAVVLFRYLLDLQVQAWPWGG